MNRRAGAVSAAVLACLIAIAGCANEGIAGRNPSTPVSTPPGPSVVTPSPTPTPDHTAAATPTEMLVVPYSFDCNDMKFFHPNGFVEPDQFARYAQAALSTLLDEAERGRSSLLSIGLHLRICGRPARFTAVKGILKLLDDLDHRIWVARRIDIARHWLATADTASQLNMAAEVGHVEA